MYKNQKFWSKDVKPGNRFVLKIQIGFMKPGIYEFIRTNTSVIICRRIFENGVYDTDENISDVHLRYALRHKLMLVFQPYKF